MCGVVEPAASGPLQAERPCATCHCCGLRTPRLRMAVLSARGVWSEGGTYLTASRPGVDN